ncbi:MAG: RluA family pseudouridine synthase, partial [Notoacmeibacter sp.]
MDKADNVGGEDVKSLEIRKFTVGAEQADVRLDVFLTSVLSGDFSRSRVQALIKAGHVTLDGKVETVARQNVAEGNLVSMAVPEAEAAHPAAQHMALEILYEDNDLIVLNKPVGLTVHPGAGTPDGTLVNALLAHCGDSLSGIGGVKRPGIVHRLDRDTSGVMVIAKNDRSHKRLSAQFADHGRTGPLERAYLALVWGAPPRPLGTISAMLGRSSNDRTKRAVVAASHPDAREAITHYRVLARYGDVNKPVASLIECQLETGRTHQIRVHMAHIGNPLIGDPLYGRGFITRIAALPETLRDAINALDRQALHAVMLAFEHPKTNETLSFET